MTRSWSDGEGIEWIETGSKGEGWRETDGKICGVIVKGWIDG